MDGQVTGCAQCGAPASSGRFCTNCGAPLPAAAAPPVVPGLENTSTSERVYGVSDDPLAADPVTAAHVAPAPLPEPVPQRPLFADDLPTSATPVYAAQPEPPSPGTTYAEPLPAEPTPPRRSPGAGLWIGAAAGLVLVLVLGAFLLLNGGGGDDQPTAASTPLIPKPQHTTTPASSAPTSSAPSTPASSAPAGSSAEVAGLAQASAPAHAPAGIDFSGQPVTFVAPNMVDGVVETCWRTPGDATGMVLTFRLDRATTLSQVGLINGYAKTAVSNGRTYDWYQGDRRVLSVDWTFDDGTTVSQTLSETRDMQTKTISPVTTSTVQVRITSVSEPGRGPAARNDTAISEVSLVGTTS